MNQRRTWWLLLGGALLGGLLPGRATAQAEVDRLQRLLRELAATDAHVWAARQAALAAEAKAHEQAAKDLRQEADKLQQRAAGEQAAAEQLRAQIELLQKLQALMAVMTKAKPVDPPAEPAAAAMPAGAAASKEELVTWRGQIEDLLGEHCATCHDRDSKKGGLDVTSFAAIREGGGSGSTLVPGQPDESRLFRLVSRVERPFMPKDEDQLPAAKIATIRRWIEQGACEDEAAARDFLAAKAKAAATATTPKATTEREPPPMPQDWPTLELRRQARAAAIRSLARSPRAALLAMPGCGQVVLFDADQQVLGVLASSLAQVESVGFSADGATLFAAGGERGRLGRVEVFDLRSGKPLALLGKERDVPLAAAVSAARRFVAVGGAGKEVHLHGLDGSLVFTGRRDDFVLAMDFSADGKLLAAADRAGNIVVYAVPSGRIEQTLTGHAGAVNAVAFGAGARVATAGADGTVRLWDATAGRELWRQSAHTGEALAVAFGPDERLASCGADGRIRVFAGDGKPVAQSPAVGDWLYAVAFGPTAAVVFAGDWLGRLHRFDVASKKLTHTLPIGPTQ